MRALALTWGLVQVCAAACTEEPDVVAKTVALEAGTRDAASDAGAVDPCDSTALLAGAGLPPANVTLDILANCEIRFRASRDPDAAPMSLGSLVDIVGQPMPAFGGDSRAEICAQNPQGPWLTQTGIVLCGAACTLAKESILRQIADAQAACRASDASILDDDAGPPEPPGGFSPPRGS